MKMLAVLVLSLALSSSAFARSHGPRCRDASGHFIKCQPAQTTVAPVAQVVAPVAAPVVAPAVVTPKVAPAQVTPEITMTTRTTKTGKVVNQCRNKKTGKFVKCPA